MFIASSTLGTNGFALSGPKIVKKRNYIDI